MAYRLTANSAFKLLLGVAATIGLAACGEKPREEYKTDVVDESGGELIADEAGPDAVDVTLPETPMTSVPEEAASPDAAPAGD